MNRKYLEKLEELNVNLSQLAHTIEIAEEMVTEYMCSDLTDDKEKTEIHMKRLWGLMVGLVEIAHLRDKECEALIQSVPITEIIEDAPEQSAED